MSRTILGLAVVALLFAPCASAQSLGDLARKTAADRDKAAKDGNTATKTYTDTDLKTLPPGPGDSATPATAPADGTAKPTAIAQKEHTAPATADATIDEAKRGEMYWRARLAPLVAQLNADIATGDQIAARLDELRARLEPNLPSFALYGAEITRLSTELRNTTEKVEADKAAIAALKEEGRKAGALPGWFR